MNWLHCNNPDLEGLAWKHHLWPNRRPHQWSLTILDVPKLKVDTFFEKTNHTIKCVRTVAKTLIACFGESINPSNNKRLMKATTRGKGTNFLRWLIMKSIHSHNSLTSLFCFSKNYQKLQNIFSNYYPNSFETQLMGALSRVLCRISMDQHSMLCLRPTKSHKQYEHTSMHPYYSDAKINQK